MTNPTGDNTLPALRSEADLVRSALADEYEIMEELGRGGMAMVFRAREKALDREVAIKILPGRLVIDQGFVDRFEHEARTAAKLEHPNIVPIYRVGRAGPNREVIYFVMKLLRGQSLSAVLREHKRLDPPHVRQILMEVASAIGYASKRGVVHRDIKPDNILLDSEGRCVVTDFGIAKSPSGQQTAEGTSLGTPRYMSPEHAMGQPLDGRSDMYSLGVVAYQCLFGKPPFEADEPFAVLYKHIHDTVPVPTLENDEQRVLFGIIERMLAKKPDDRFQTAQDLIAALGGHVSAPTLVAPARTSVGVVAETVLMPTPRPWHLSRWHMLPKRRQRMWMGVGVATFIAAVSLFAIDLTPTAPPPLLTDQAPVKPAPGPSSQPGEVVAKVPAAGAPSPKPAGPSPRAAEILKYNEIRSNCPKRDTVATAKLIRYAVLLDSIADRSRGDKMEVGYDVCGLKGGSPFTADFALIKTHQKGLERFQQHPHNEQQIETAGSPRSREKLTLDIHEMSEGTYRLEVVVTDVKKQQVKAAREFRIGRP
jgi:serine/threonine-protein kinase